MTSEADAIAILCGLLMGGDAEERVPYDIPDRPSFDAHVRVDCETPTRVIEVGTDRRSSLDSVQQALFAAEMTGKVPLVAIIDTDATEGRFEYRIRIAAEAAGVEYRSYSKNFLIRWRMTRWLRQKYRR